MKNILVVEDDERIRKYLKAAMSNLGYFAYMKENGKKALMDLENILKEIEIILSDINMPYMNGIEFAREVKRQWPSLAIPVILMTGGLIGIPRNLRETTNTKIILVKPFGFTDLETALKAISDNQPLKTSRSLIYI